MSAIIFYAEVILTYKVSISASSKIVYLTLSFSKAISYALLYPAGIIISLLKVVKLSQICVIVGGTVPLKYILS